MKSRRKIIAMIVVLLLGATMYGLYRTVQPANAPVAPDRTKYGGAAPAPIVDQTPLLTAQRLAKMALSAEELPFAQESLRLGDQEMALGFAAAVREAEEHPPVLSTEAKGIQARLQQAERALEADEAQVKQLTAEEEKATGEKRDALDDQLDVAKAQLELDQDEVDDAKQDLIRAGGDPQGRIQTTVEEHEAASHVADSLKVTVTALVEMRGLIHRFQQWSVLHQKQLDLWRAKQDAESLAASFSAKHNAMEAQIAAARRKSTEVARAGKHASGGREESTALLKATKRRSANEKALAGFDNRVPNEKQLAEGYGNGIRLGDWVEINGVTGEVVELNMFHTVLLETGNWTDSGHPTGRRVTFTNSFAIEGHYFNFSTSGQWLWDELQVVLPAGQDPYPIVDAIQKKVAEATAESAKQAEQEWQHAARSRDMRSLSAAPAINVKPVIGGIEIAVRYVTRANERYQLRAKLNQAAVDLLGQRGAPPVTKQA